MPGGEIVKLDSTKCLLIKNEDGRRLIPEKFEKVLYAEFKFRMLGDKRERSVHHKLEPRARSEGMATRRGVWQVATTPPDR